MKTAKQLGFPNPARPTADGAHMTVHDVTFTVPAAEVVLHGAAPAWHVSRKQYEYPLDGADLLMVAPLTEDLETPEAVYVAVYRFFLAEQPNGFDYWQPMVHEWNYGDAVRVAVSDVPTRGRK